MHNGTRNKLHSQFLKLQLINKKEEYIHPSFLMETRLQEAIMHADLSQALNILESINKDQRPSLATTSIVRSLKNSLICSCTLFTRAIINGGINPEKAFTLSDVYILEIESRETVESLSNLEYDMLKHFIDVLGNEDISPYSNTVNQSVAYISENILQDLSLKSISDYCYVNSSYLSHIFKKEVGLSIVKYINKKRVEEAKHLLLHTTSSISEIALLFRFCNQSYFTQQFKLYEGLTPKEFRDKRFL
ncbi:helix-turn-helix domain-containing protein [Radiobacillus sp. PE A8.2]|uniref:helix-turn-helix domain-containing protein n=1 Tax=Radiobacillus sp. PE A8.2 TaxID=3380349 RepID=UPI0038903BB4